MVSACECLYHLRVKHDTWFILNVYSGAKVKLSIKVLKLLILGHMLVQ